MTTVVKLRVVAGNSRMRAGRPQAVFRRPMLIHICHAALLPCCALALRSRFENGMVGARHGHGIACVNQMDKTQSKPLSTRHGRGTVWARHIMCELAFTKLLTLQLAPAFKPCCQIPFVRALPCILLRPCFTRIQKSWWHCLNRRDIASKCLST